MSFSRCPREGTAPGSLWTSWQGNQAKLPRAQKGGWDSSVQSVHGNGPCWARSLFTRTSLETKDEAGTAPTSWAGSGGHWKKSFSWLKGKPTTGGSGSCGRQGLWPDLALSKPGICRRSQDLSSPPAAQTSVGGVCVEMTGRWSNPDCPDSLGEVMSFPFPTVTRNLPHTHLRDTRVPQTQ